MTKSKVVITDNFNDKTIVIDSDHLPVGVEDGLKFKEDRIEI